MKEEIRQINDENLRRINGRIEQVNETINQKVDKNDEERKQEIAKTNERLEQVNETLERDRVDLGAKINHVKEGNRVQMAVIQKEQENLEKVQKQCGERCDHIDAAVTNKTGQVHQNQEEIELIRTRPTHIASIPTIENREGKVNF